MKKKRIDFESQFWSGSKKHSNLRLLETFFRFNELTTAKEMLNTIVQYALKKKEWIKKDTSAVFHFHQSMRSFIRAGYLIKMKAKKWTINNPPDNTFPIMQGSLSNEEYQNPLIVFQKAFKDYSIKEFDYFMSGMVYFSLGAYKYGPESNIISPYIHFNKMLDAAYIILKKGITKNN